MPEFIAFDGWTASPGYFGGGWAAADNLYAFYGTSRPFRKFNASGSLLFTNPVTGAYSHPWMVNPTASTYSPDASTLFAGVDVKLYTVDPSTGAFTNVSRGGGYGGVGISPAAWRFATIGNDVWATNWYDAMQRRTNNAGNFANGAVSTFKPVPRFMAPLREHLVVANLNQALRFQDEVAWSDADDATNFDPATATSLSIAGSKRLVATPGQITGLLGGQYGLVFKRRSIYYLEYTGTSQVLRPDVLSPHVGTKYPSSIINSRYGVFFVGPDGFYQIKGLAEPQKVSPPGIDQFLLDSGFTSQAGPFTSVQEDGQLMSFQCGALPLVGWGYRLNWNDIGVSFALVYNPITDAWRKVATTDQTGQVISAFVDRPSAESLYQEIGAFSHASGSAHFATLDATGGTGYVHAPTLQLRYRPADLENADLRQQSLVYGVLPVFSKAGGTASTALTESVTVEAILDPHLDVWKTETATSPTRDSIAGFYPFQVAGRFFRITITCAAEDFANFEGVYIWQRLLT